MANGQKNSLGQPLGDPVEDWTPRPWPSREAMQGKYCRVEAINISKHAADLYEAFSADLENRIWTYMPYGPLHSTAECIQWIEETCLSDDPLFHAIIDLKSDRAVGVASFLRITPSAGVIEVGHINYAPALQRTAAATEAMFLMMERVFDQLGYRRYEWKCDALNARSRAAAERLGFTFEGIFRQATLYKGRNRDTAWYSIVDHEWPAIRTGFRDWLSPQNLDAKGQQVGSLSTLIAARRGEPHG